MIGYLVIDQGTTSSRAAIFSSSGEILTIAQKEFTQHFPSPGWVEHDANEIWEITKEVCVQAVYAAETHKMKLLGIGITNQRETVVFWDKQTGEALYPAIVWQDRRTADFCDSIKDQEQSVYDKTGLLLDPYFSASKIRWLLKNQPRAAELLKENRLLCGTIDSFLIWKMTEGKSHVTDTTNASRTSLFNIHNLRWDDSLLSLFEVPREILPRVVPSIGFFGSTKAFTRKPIPITAVAGDQQAALVGQCCVNQGDAKCTFGTGSFLMVNTGDKPGISMQSRLLTTVALHVGDQVTYALEGSVFVAGAALQFLRDGLHTLESAPEVSRHFIKAQDVEGVYFVPALTGLGAPHWAPEATGAIFGLTRGSSEHHINSAAVHAACYQTLDLIKSIESCHHLPIKLLNIDGGMSSNDDFNKSLADLLQIEIRRPTMVESTARGMYHLCLMADNKIEDLHHLKTIYYPTETYLPALDKAKAGYLYSGWQKAIKATLTFSLAKA